MILKKIPLPAHAWHVRLSPHRITFKHLPLPLRSDIRSFGTLGQLFKRPPFYDEICHSAGGRVGPWIFFVGGILMQNFKTLRHLRFCSQGQRRHSAQTKKNKGLGSRVRLSGGGVFLNKWLFQLTKFHGNKTEYFFHIKVIFQYGNFPLKLSSCWVISL
jgi:hypothetical protein